MVKFTVIGGGASKDLAKRLARTGNPDFVACNAFYVDSMTALMTRILFMSGVTWGTVQTIIAIDLTENTVYLMCALMTFHEGRVAIERQYANEVAEHANEMQTHFAEVL